MLDPRDALTLKLLSMIICALVDYPEFVVIDWDTPGLAHLHLLAAKVEIRRYLGNPIGGSPPGFERTEIQDRINLEETAQIARLGRIATRQDLPGKTRGPIGEQGFHGIRRHSQGPS